MIEIPAESFSYGGSLNTGSAQARAPLIVALSAHAFPPDEHWLERLRRPFADERVACACGYPKGPDGDPLTGRVVQDLEHGSRTPVLGLLELLGRLPRRALARAPVPRGHARHRGQGVGLALAPAGAAWWSSTPTFATEHSHRDEGPRHVFARARNEWAGYAAYLDLEPYGVPELVPRLVERPRRLPVAPAGAHRLAARRPAGREVARALQPRVIIPAGWGCFEPRRVDSRRVGPGEGASEAGSSPTGASAGPPTVPLELSNAHYAWCFTDCFGLPLELYDGKRVLDVGCGPRGSLEWAERAAERVGLDPLADEYQRLHSREHAMTYVAAPAESIPFPDGHFDVVSTMNSLDHVDDLARRSPS